MNVIGIDPSLAATGICGGANWGSVVKTKASDPARLTRISAAIDTFVRAEPGGFTLAVLEDLPTHAMSAGLTGQAQGVVRHALQVWGTPFITVAPASLKKFATGSGRADKGGMRDAMLTTFGYVPEGWDDNVIDAFWLREMGLWYLKEFAGVRLAHFSGGTAKWSKIYPKG